MLRDEQIQALILCSLRGSGELDRDQLDRFINRCSDALMDAALVQLGIEGKVTVNCTDQDPDNWVWTMVDGSSIAERV